MLALAVWPMAVRADDAGPRRDVAAIRHDLAKLRAVTQIDSVVVNDDQALAQWGSVNAARVAWMQYRYGRWWLRHEIWIEDSGAAAFCCPGFSTPMNALGPTPSFLAAMGVPSKLVAIASAHLPLVEQATARPTPTPRPCPTGGIYCLQPASIHGEGFVMDRLLFGYHALQRLETDNMGSYTMSAQFAPADASPDAGITHITGRAPTEAESWANPPSGNSYFFFSGTVQAAQPVHVQAGTTVDVWFPSVLDPSVRYSLTIGAPRVMSLGPVEGTLKDNTLHFVLPAFTATPGDELMGEIQGN
jgi:hypothetical protein